MNPSENPERVLSFTEHLEELRVRIIIVIIFFVITFIISFFFAPRVVELLIAPLTHIAPAQPPQVLTLRARPDGALQIWGLEGVTSQSVQFAPQQLRIENQHGKELVRFGSGKNTSNLFFLSPLEPFMLWMQGALLISAVFAIPMAIYQFWLFVAPGLVRRERRIIKPLLVSSMLLFPIGALFAYFISRFALKFLLSFGDAIPGLAANIVASKYISFILVLMLIFGVIFEFPLVLLLLSRIGVIDSTTLVKRRKSAIVIIAIVSAIATPSPDPFSMGAMLLPLIILYEGSLYVIRMLERRDRAAAAEEEASEVSD